MLWTEHRNKILEEIKPNLQDISLIYKIISKIKEKIRKIKGVSEIHLGGSIPKKTFLKNDFDIDFFIKINDLETSVEKFFKVCETIFLNYTYKYCKTPYILIKDTYQGKEYTFDLIPYCNLNPENYKFERTLNHVSFVNKFLENPDQVLILKSILKSVNLYGAESSIMGFSGYALEVLMIKYKTINVLFNNLSDFDINSLTLKDPTDLDRNLLSPVSKTNFMALYWILYEIFINKNYKPIIKTALNFKEPLFEYTLIKPVASIFKDKYVSKYKKLKTSISKNFLCFFYLLDDKTLLLQNPKYGMDVIKKIKGPNVLDSKNIRKFLRKYPDSILYNNGFISFSKINFELQLNKLCNFYKLQSDKINFEDLKHLIIGYNKKYKVL